MWRHGPRRRAAPLRARSWRRRRPGTRCSPTSTPCKGSAPGVTSSSTTSANCIAGAAARSAPWVANSPRPTPRARSDVAASFSRWEAGIRNGLRAMHARGELRTDAAPDNLALATLAALQGGLLLTQIQRQTRPLEVALDAMLDHVASLTAPA